MSGIVRPFNRILEHSDASTAIVVAGEIRGNKFILIVESAEFSIPILSVETDKHGALARLEPQTLELGNRLVLMVEHEYSPDDPSLNPGLEIRLYRKASEETVERIEQMAGVHGFLLNSVNLIIPPELSLSVHFSSLGHVDGLGWCGQSFKPKDEIAH
jgi:hypothetical protein